MPTPRRRHGVPDVAESIAAAARPLSRPADFDPDSPKWRVIGADLGALFAQVDERLDREDAAAALITGT